MHTEDACRVLGIGGCEDDGAAEATTVVVEGDLLSLRVEEADEAVSLAVTACGDVHRYGGGSERRQHEGTGTVLQRGVCCGSGEVEDRTGQVLAARR